MKAKYGIIERENYNLPKSEDAKQPQCPKEKEDAIVPENPEETENPAEQEKPAEIVEQPVRETLVAEAEKQKCRWILWVAAFVGILIILVILVFLFKEELMPLLEKLLYSKEELEILHKVGR